MYFKVLYQVWMDDDVKSKPNDMYKILELYLSIFIYGYLCYWMYHEILTGLEERIVNKGTHRLLL